MPPFITSKLQQAARFPVKKTMMVAQQLYEGDRAAGRRVRRSHHLHANRLDARVGAGARPRCASSSGSAFGAEYVPEKPNFYKTKADAQDAHEAIRPTSMQYHPETVRAHLTPDQYYLYKLIWNRFVASQMPPATFDETTVDISAGDVSVPRQGLRAEVRRLDGGLQPGRHRSPSSSERAGRGPMPSRRRTRRARACCRRSPKAIGSS